MINPYFRVRIAAALSIERFDIGAMPRIGQSANELIIEHHVLVQLNYRFGKAYFATIQTPKELQVGLMVHPSNKRHEANWEQTGTCHVKAVHNLELPIWNALSMVDLNPRIMKKDITENSLYSCGISIAGRGVLSESVFRGPTQNPNATDFWRSMLKTLKLIALTIDNEDSRDFIENYSKYLDEA